MIKPFARGRFPEGSKRQHHFSFYFVILNMAWAWSDYGELSNTPESRGRYSWQESALADPTGNQRHHSNSLPLLLLLSQPVQPAPGLLASQGMCEGAGPAVINILDCYFLLELQHPGWGGTSRVWVCKGTGPTASVSQVSLARTAVPGLEGQGKVSEDFVVWLGGHITAGALTAVSAG